MNRRHFVAGMTSFALGGVRQRTVNAKGALIGLGLTLDEFMWMYGDPDDMEESDGYFVSTYDFGDFSIIHAVPMNEPESIVWRIECYPNRPTDFEELTDYSIGFMPSDAVLLGNEELAMTEASIRGTYYSEIVLDTFGDAFWHQPPGEVKILYFRDDDKPNTFTHAEIQLAMELW